MKKTFLYILLLTFMACKIEVNVEDETHNKSLEEVWSIDIPRTMQVHQVFNFRDKDKLYFVSRSVQIFSIHQVDIVSRELKELKIDWKSFGINESDWYRISNIKHKGGNLFFTVNKELFAYNLANQGLKKIASDILYFEFGDTEQQIYTINTNNEFGTFGLQNTDYQTIIKLSNKSYVENICIFNNTKGELLAFINAFQKNFLCNISAKKIENERIENYETEGSNRELYFAPPMAYSSIDKFYKFNMISGNIEWQASNLNLGYGYYSIAFDEKDNRVFIIEKFKNCICIDAKTGKTIWTEKLDVIPHNEYAVSTRSALVLLNGFLYASNGEQLLILNAKNGKEVQRQSEDYSIGIPSIVDEKNGLIYTFKSGKLCALKGLK